VKTQSPWVRVLYAAGTLGGLAFFFYLLWGSYVAVQQYGVALARPEFLALALVCALGMYAVQMLAWRRIMQQLGYPLALGPVVTGFFWSFVPRYIPGSVWGYWSRGAWLSGKHGISYRASTFGSLLEIGLGCATALVVGGGYLLAARYARSSVLIGALAALTAATIVLVPVTRSVGVRFFGVRVAGSPATRMVGWAGTLAFYMLAWLSFGLCAFYIARAFFVPNLDTGIFVGAAALAWLTGFLAVIVPSGLGVRELALTALLTAAGMPAWQGGLIAVVFRFVIVFVELVWLVIGLLVGTARRHRAPRSSQTGR
jgi:uncharacterized membrane protein YbhN (UPF0104 family)